MKKINKVLALLCTAGMLCAVGCDEDRASSNGVTFYDEANEYTQEAEGYENEAGEKVEKEDLVENIPTTPIEIGQDAVLSDMSVSISNVYNLGVIKANEVTVNYDRDVVAVLCKITNNSDKPVNITAYDFEVKYIDGDNTELTTDVEAMLKAMEIIPEFESLNATVEPGQTIEGYAAFSIYSKWEDVTIYYSPVGAEKNDALSLYITRDMAQTFE